MPDKDYTLEQIIEWWKCCTKRSPEHHCMKCPMQEDCIDVTQEPEDFYKHIALCAAELLNDVMEREKKQWISVEDRLPERIGYTIVLLDDRQLRHRRVSFAKYQNVSKRWELTGRRSYWRVTHWMPLPEPPEEVKQDA